MQAAAGAPLSLAGAGGGHRHNQHNALLAVSTRRGAQHAVDAALVDAGLKAKALQKSGTHSPLLLHRELQLVGSGSVGGVETGCAAAGQQRVLGDVRATHLELAGGHADSREAGQEPDQAEREGDHAELDEVSLQEIERQHSVWTL